MRREFEIEIKECDRAIEDLNRNHKRLGNGKLAVLAVIAAMVVLGITNGFGFTLCIGILAFFEIYLLLAVIHWKVEKLLNENTIKRKINGDYIDRMDGNWGHFSDKGDEYIDRSHNYSFDLDIFGENSLFQYLNTTKTHYGRQQFVKDLTDPSYDLEKIKNRQKAVWELSSNKNFTVDLQFYGSLTDIQGDGAALIGLLKGEAGESVHPLTRYLLYLPIFSTVFMLAVFFMEVSALYIPAASLLAIHVLLGLYCFFKLSGDLNKITSAGYKIGEYARIFDLIERKTFECDELKSIKSKIISDDIKVSAAIIELNFVIMKIDARRNGLLFFLLNLFFLWDYSCLYSLRKWRGKYQNYVEGWFDALGQLESLLSFTNLSFVEENACIPEITENMAIVGEGIGHPLVNASQRVNNNVSQNNEIFIISGSNMSGKTTFLRTIGVNMVLGLAGGFCCGEKLSLPKVDIATSMRNFDNLAAGVSTFYAELERVKEIINKCKGGKAIFLIDEIFRGTNSKDRLEGAASVLKNLEAEGAMGVITTHDLELCNIADDMRIVNYSFNERYENNEIIFDYKLTKGKSDTTNAKFLMNKLGIIE